MSLRRALDRTLLLMRDEVGDRPSNDILLAALTDAEIAIVADVENLRSHAAQTALVTAATLMGRSGHKVYLDVPNMQMVGIQSPLAPGALLERLLELGGDLLPGVDFAVGPPAGEVDLVVALGDTEVRTKARRCVRINADDWTGRLQEYSTRRRWDGADWPFGGMAAGAMAAGEAFKVSMNKLLPYALNAENTGERFLALSNAEFSLAPRGTQTIHNLGEVDFVSAGAISHATLFALARIPAVEVRGRLIEPDVYDLSNLNRYMLLRRSGAKSPKAAHLVHLLADAFQFEPIPHRYDEGFGVTSRPMAATIMVGVDHIPTRWEAQRVMPDWLTVGATSHWSAMASFHRPGLGCAHCLHYRDDPGGAPIPTAACVSFWAGLMSARYLVDKAASGDEQQMYFSPFRPDKRPYRAPVPPRPRCPTCGGSGVGLGRTA
jgi:hypothetical protein